MPPRLPAANPPGDVSVRALLLGNGPRIARDAAGPVLAFYLGWKLIGLGTGVTLATAGSVAAYAWERRRSRSGLGAAIGLGIALVQALAGLMSGSAIAYFAPGVIANGLYGLAFLASVVIRRPLAGVFARESYPFPPEVKTSPMFLRVFSRISLVWGVIFLLRTALRVVALASGSVDRFVVVNLATGFPLTAALVSWSFWYGVRSLQRAAEIR